MTNATVHDFVKELKECNKSKSGHIQVGRGIDRVIYTGGNPRELIPPHPFAWDEEHKGFSDLAALRANGMLEMYQLFTVETGEF